MVTYECVHVFVYFVKGSCITGFQDEARRSGLNGMLLKKKKVNKKEENLLQQTVTREFLTPAFLPL